MGYLKRNRRGFLHAVKHNKTQTWLLHFFNRFLDRFAYHRLIDSVHLADAEQHQLNVIMFKSNSFSAFFAGCP